MHGTEARKKALQGVRLHNPDYVKFAPPVRCGGPTFELPGEAVAGVSPPQGPTASRPVGGLSTLRSFVGMSVQVRAALHPQSAQPPATSALMLVSG